MSTICPGCPGGCGRSHDSAPTTTSPPQIRRTRSLRDRVGAFFADREMALPDGRVTALLQARVFGYVFNPMSVFWCHDRDGLLRHVVAEVHNTYGERHAYLLPPADLPVVTAKKFYVSPFNQVDGYYLVRAPLPDNEVDITVALHRDSQPAFTANLRGHAAAGERPANRDDATRFTAGAAGGGHAHPDPGDQVVVTPSSGGAAMSVEIIQKTLQACQAIDSARWPAVARVPSARSPWHRRRSSTGCCAARPPGCRCGLPTPTARCSAPPTRPHRPYWCTGPTRWHAGSGGTA